MGGALDGLDITGTLGRLTDTSRVGRAGERALAPVSSSGNALSASALKRSGGQARKVFHDQHYAPPQARQPPGPRSASAPLLPPVQRGSSQGWAAAPSPSPQPQPREAW